jgi:hypothetical protein
VLVADVGSTATSIRKRIRSRYVCNGINGAASTISHVVVAVVHDVQVVFDVAVRVEDQRLGRWPRV